MKTVATLCANAHYRACLLVIRQITQISAIVITFHLVRRWRAMIEPTEGD